MVHQTGIIKIAQFDGAIAFFLQTNPCSYGNRTAVFEQKIGCSSAM